LGPRRIVYRNRYHHIYRQTADFGDFKKEYFVNKYRPRAAVVAERDGMILLVRQYRLIIDGLSWEIPGGQVDEGESPAKAAARECIEEAGVRCRALRPLVFFHTGVDNLYNPTHVFYSRDCAVARNIEDRHEVERLAWVPIGRCRKMLRDGKIIDGLSVTALLAYFLRKKEGHRR
jgi:8-oxo-dGTP pyrophosphatase MutT (NUDIX family)